MKYTQIHPVFTQENGKEEVLFLSIKCHDNPNFTIINTYNAPLVAVNPGAGISPLISLAANQFPTKTILAGDLNLHHPNWNPGYSGDLSTQAEDFICWLERNNLFLLSEIDVPTHNRGNVLDLCFASCTLLSLGSTATVQQDLDVTSDQLPILIENPNQSRKIPPPSRLRFATIDQEILIHYSTHF